jgi:hypothetical protein
VAVAVENVRLSQAAELSTRASLMALAEIAFANKIARVLIFNAICIRAYAPALENNGML